MKGIKKKNEDELENEVNGTPSINIQGQTSPCALMGRRLRMNVRLCTEWPRSGGSLIESASSRIDQFDSLDPFCRPAFAGHGQLQPVGDRNGTDSIDKMFFVALPLQAMGHGGGGP